MSSSLKKLGSKIFIYLVAFVLLFSFIFLFVLGIGTSKLRENISNSFEEFGKEVDNVSVEMMNENTDSFIENFVDVEANAFSYVIKDLKYDLRVLSDSAALRFTNYNIDEKYYIDNIKNHELYQDLSSEAEKHKKLKVFYEPGVDRNSAEVLKDLGILYDMEDDLLLTIKDSLQTKNCYIMTERGVAMFASSYDYNNSAKYAGDELSYKVDDWYQEVIATSSIVFDSIYKDALTGNDLISVNKAIVVDNVVQGVVAIEVYVDSLRVNNVGLEPPQGANLFIVDDTDRIIYNARADLYDDEVAREGTFYEFLDEAKGKLKGRGVYSYNGNDYRCFYKNVSDTKLTLYVSIRENKVQENITELQKMIKDKNASLISMVYTVSWRMYAYVLALAIFIIAILFFVARKVSDLLATPVEEFSNLLTQASKIQQDMLPDEFESISNRKDIEIYAHNIPEAEVGGDFYNYIIRNNKLYLIIADVSGSGMPAALFMAKTNELLSNAIKLSESPRVILSYVNAELCKNNNECYFVTIALYCIDLKTRRVVFSNSGHEDSIIIKSSNEVVEKKEIRSAPMGLDEYNNYEEDEFILDIGDVLFLYTDGVVEATNKEDELFGIDRLTTELKELGAIDTKSIVLGIEKKLDEFAAGVDQYDDITMVCFKFKKLDIDESKVFKYEKEYKAIYESIEEVGEFVEECIRKAYGNLDIYEKYANGLNVCIEEIVVNICDYAYGKINDASNIFNIDVVVDKNVDKLSISFIDSGKAFDPTKMKSANILQGVDERNIGGFGIHITKSIVDILEYERKDEKNILTITKYL